MKRSVRALATAVMATGLLGAFASGASAGQPRPGDLGVDIYAVAGTEQGIVFVAGELTSPTRKCRVERRIKVRAGGQLYDSGLSSSRATFGLTTNNVEDSELVIPPKKVKSGGRTVQCIGYKAPLLLN